MAKLYDTDYRNDITETLLSRQGEPWQASLADAGKAFSASGMTVPPGWTTQGAVPAVPAIGAPLLAPQPQPVRPHPLQRRR